MRTDSTRLANAYEFAKRHVLERGFAPEIDWQHRTNFDQISEQTFLSEAAWVVLSCGMREAVVRKLFGAITVAFCGWESSSRIVRESDACIASALGVFNHRKKITAIATIASRVDARGFPRLKSDIAQHGVARLREFPFMGPATSYHLAKNIGMDVVKPDRHLLRITQVAGYPCPDSLCRDISSVTGDRIGVIDLILWRFATLEPAYLNVFSLVNFNSDGPRQTISKTRSAAVEAAPREEFCEPGFS